MLTAALALAAFAAFAPGYWTTVGFPLDDAWIHLVYGRSLAREGMLAYNPGEPATGATSLLWAVVLAVPHLLASTTPQVVLVVKAIGFACQVAGGVWMAWALAPATAGPVQRGAVGAFVVLNAALVAASVSGMEGALSRLLVAWLVHACVRVSIVEIATASVLAVLARPELGLVAVLVPAGLGLAKGLRLDRRAAAGAVGAVAAIGLSFARNLIVSGRPLPATFYEKVGVSPLGALEAMRRGFIELLAQLPFAGPIWLAVAITLAVVVWRRAPETRSAVVAIGTAVCYFAVSFRLVPPFDVGAFYHQRYVLPALSLFLAGFAWLVLAAVSWIPRERLRQLATGAVAVTAFAVLAGALPDRLGHLLNDARNIDDVQVAEGKSLSAERPERTVWAVDAGAIRYFGSAYVVDTMGLNVVRGFSQDTASYLSAHPPAWFELVEGWSATDPGSAASLVPATFTTTTEYSVTRFPEMGTHVLAACPAGVEGTFAARSRRLPFRCAP